MLCQEDSFDLFNDDFINFDLGLDLGLSTGANIIGNKSKTDEEVEKILSERKAKTTGYKDKSDYTRFKAFLREEDTENDKHKDREIEDIAARELDEIFCKFFMHAKKKNGELYQPDSLTSIRNSLQRVLTDRGSKINLKTSMEFERSRKVLAARRKQLTQLGLGSKPNATRPLEDSEVEKLKEMGYFGWENSEQLQRLMWWCITTQFGYRARDESRKLCFGDIVLCRDADGQKYLEWDTERGSKTRTGEKTSSHQRAFNPKAYETGSWDCPVVTYEHFCQHRPADAKMPNSPFFLAAIKPSQIKDDIWFFSRPLGKNKLGEFLSKAAPALGITDKSRSKVANHSARKTSISKLLDNNIHPLHVSQLSGHKNINNLKSYHAASRPKQQQMSKILANDFHATSTATSTAPSTAPSCSSVQHTPLVQASNLNSSSAQNHLGSTCHTFSGANIQNCVFNIITQSQIQSPVMHKKRRWVIYDSESE